MPIHRQSNNLTMSRSSGASFKTNSATGFRDKNVRNAQKIPVEYWWDCKN